MMRFTVEDGAPNCVADLRGRIGVYLDNDSSHCLTNPLLEL